MDLSSGFDLPNPFGLLAADFGHDLDSYRCALGFLSDLATGSEHDEALTTNGGDKGMLIGWQHSDKFRRVYAKCRRAGEEERKYEQNDPEERAEATWEGEGGAVEPNRLALGSFTLPEPPRRQGGLFSASPNRGRWGHA